ncbi:MAG: TadE family protein [Acidimicrobiales bacterium]
MSGRRDEGQATVELALVLPVVAMLVLAIVQFTVVGHAEVVTVHAAREGARAAAVGGSDADVRAAVLRQSGLPGGRVQVSITRSADAVAVEVRYVQATDIALVGPLVGDVAHVAAATMRREDIE